MTYDYLSHTIVVFISLQKLIDIVNLQHILVISRSLFKKSRILSDWRKLRALLSSWYLLLFEPEPRPLKDRKKVGAAPPAREEGGG